MNTLKKFYRFASGLLLRRQYNGLIRYTWIMEFHGAPSRRLTWKQAKGIIITYNERDERDEADYGKPGLFSDCVDRILGGLKPLWHGPDWQATPWALSVAESALRYVGKGYDHFSAYAQEVGTEAPSRSSLQRED